MSLQRKRRFEIDWCMNIPPVFFELHSDLPREAPGDDRWTRIAMEILRPAIPGGARILDLGCGPGAQTLCLAEANPNSPVLAIDIHQPYLDEVMRRARQASLQSQIRVLLNDIIAPENLEKDHFDLIWSEGSIYIPGFEKGLQTWRPYLTESGCMGISELTWISSSPSPEAIAFWNEAYPEMKNVEENFQIIQKNGYQVVGHFILPRLAWLQNYYIPLQNRINLLRENYREDPESLSVLDQEESEIRLFEEHSDSYGYVFYLIQKTNSMRESVDIQVSPGSV